MNNNFFFAPSKATPESPEYLLYLQATGNVRLAEANATANQDRLRRLRRSLDRVDVSCAACIITAPTENRATHEGTQIPVGRGVYEIGEYALEQGLPVYIIRKNDLGLVAFHPVIHLNKGAGKGDWKTNYAVAVLEPPVELQYVLDLKSNKTAIGAKVEAALSIDDDEDLDPTQEELAQQED